MNSLLVSFGLRLTSRAEPTPQWTSCFEPPVCSWSAHLSRGSWRAARSSERLRPLWTRPPTSGPTGGSWKQRWRSEGAAAQRCVTACSTRVFTQKAQGGSGSRPLSCSLREERRRMDTSPGERERERESCTLAGLLLHITAVGLQEALQHKLNLERIRCVRSLHSRKVEELLFFVSGTDDVQGEETLASVVRGVSYM